MENLLNPPRLPRAVRRVENQLTKMGLTLRLGIPKVELARTLTPEPEAITTPLRLGPPFKVWTIQHYWSLPLRRTRSVWLTDPEQIWTAKITVKLIPRTLMPANLLGFQMILDTTRERAVLTDPTTTLWRLETMERLLTLEPTTD
jgi:hypothetical protein